MTRDEALELAKDIIGFPVVIDVRGYRVQFVLKDVQVHEGPLLSISASMVTDRAPTLIVQANDG